MRKNSVILLLRKTCSPKIADVCIVKVRCRPISDKRFMLRFLAVPAVWQCCTRLQVTMLLCVVGVVCKAAAGLVLSCSEHCAGGNVLQAAVRMTSTPTTRMDAKASSSRSRRRRRCKAEDGTRRRRRFAEFDGRHRGQDGSPGRR